MSDKRNAPHDVKPIDYHRWKEKLIKQVFLAQGLAGTPCALAFTMKEVTTSPITRSYCIRGLATEHCMVLVDDDGSEAARMLGPHRCPGPDAYDAQCADSDSEGQPAEDVSPICKLA